MFDTTCHTWRHDAPNSSVGLPVSKPNQLCKQYPVFYQDRLAWNYIPYFGPERTKTILFQSSGTSPYGPLSGVYPTGVKRTVMLQSAVETPQEHTHIMGYKWKKAVFYLWLNATQMQGPCIFGINQELTWYLVSMVSAKNPDPPFGDQRWRPETACKSFRLLLLSKFK